MIIWTRELQWKKSHNPYFNRWFSAILKERTKMLNVDSHNPYFNRWFSAINLIRFLQCLHLCHNPYFNRWFSAISKEYAKRIRLIWSHNPYFNRWFSAIYSSKSNSKTGLKVTILILIDGFLQSIRISSCRSFCRRSQSLF